MTIKQRVIEGNKGSYFTFLPEAPIDLSAGGQHEIDIEYSDLAPDDSSATLYIQKAILMVWGPQAYSRGASWLKIEKAEPEGFWVMLCSVQDGQFQNSEDLPDVPMTSADTLCLTVNNLIYEAAQSSLYTDGAINKKRHVTVQVYYRVGD